MFVLSSAMRHLLLFCSFGQVVRSFEGFHICQSFDGKFRFLNLGFVVMRGNAVRNWNWVQFYLQRKHVISI
ncbi:hypothetical protein M758_3G091500 [Ceratodon purpureus]|nr:hypothetical protein M758_3G091500 [Ceratodon purpureus]